MADLYLGGADPTVLDPVTTASIGSFSKRVFQNTLPKTPYLDSLLGRPRGQELDSAVAAGSAVLADGSRTMEGSPAIYEQIWFKQPVGGKYIQHLDSWQYTRQRYNGWMQYPWRYYIWPIVYSMQEKLENKGGARGIKLIDLVESYVEQATLAALASIGKDLIQSTGAGADAQKILGLEGALPSDPTLAGSTVGGWDLSKYPDMRSKYNGDLPNTPAAGAAGDFGENYGSFFRRMYNEIYKGLFVSRTKLILVSQEIHEGLEGILQPRERVWRDIGGNSEKPMGQDGYRCLVYKDAEVVWDQHMLSGRAFFLGFPGIRLNIMSDLWNKVMDWRELQSQLGKGTVVAFALNHSVGQPRAQGRIDGLTTS
jgi:hypothetical protein